MALEQLKKELKDLTFELFQEGFLDEQFRVLRRYDQGNDRNFSIDMTNMYFEDAKTVPDELTVLLNMETVEFSKVDGLLCKLKGSSASIGAQRVKNVCAAFEACSRDSNREGCLINVQQLTEEISVLKTKIEYLFTLEKKLIVAGDDI